VLKIYGIQAKHHANLLHIYGMDGKIVSTLKRGMQQNFGGGSNEVHSNFKRTSLEVKTNFAQS
jgi:hypothetical protein